MTLANITAIVLSLSGVLCLCTLPLPQNPTKAQKIAPFIGGILVAAAIIIAIFNFKK